MVRAMRDQFCQSAPGNFTIVVSRMRSGPGILYLDSPDGTGIGNVFYLVPFIRLERDHT